jgi:hypothetical protein
VPFVFIGIAVILGCIWLIVDEYMADTYDHFRAKLHDTGFYAPSTEDMGGWDRIIPCSEGPPETVGYGGRSFWIACVDNTWYIGTWGSFIYRFPNEDSLLPFTRAFLTATDRIDDFSPELKHEFSLSPLSDDEVERILPDGRPEE